MNIGESGKIRKGLLTALLFLAVVQCCGCSNRPDSGNYPYVPDTPTPAPHEGVFASEHGTMTFLGDDESVIIDFDEALSGCLGMSAGEQEAKYVFLSGNLPPHGNVPIRYDVAHMIEIITGDGEDKSYTDIDIGEYQDGTFYTGTNCTTPERITFFVKLEDDGEREAVDFLKQDPTDSLDED